MPYYLQIPGREAPLSLLYSGCHNITVATVNECGMSVFSSAQVTQPPGKALAQLCSVLWTELRLYCVCVSVME